MKNFDKVMVVLRRFKDKLKAFVIEYDLQILLIIFSLLPISIVWFSDYDIKAKVLFTTGITLCVITLLLKLSIKILEFQMSLKIPLYGKRFTSKEENGEIYIKKEDLQEALLYLYEIEEFVKNNSLEG